MQKTEDNSGPFHLLCLTQILLNLTFHSEKFTEKKRVSFSVILLIFQKNVIQVF